MPIHLSDAYAELGLAAGSLPVSERLARRSCSLAFFPGMTDDDLDRLADGVASFSADRPVAWR
jgi:dTDP-4-amino-4,6-dideoxygalactose transaminase